jgi:SAM-dependent methyltransferase
MRKSRTLDRAYFEDLYRQDGDPWRFETSAYEREKYGRTLAALGAARARRALEVGCSIGVLTEQLAARCDHLIATDISTAALDQARRRCANLPHVVFKAVRGAGDSFEGTFDLIVLSEVVYYWDDADIVQAAAKLATAMATGGRLLLVHWLGETDYPQSADDAVTKLGRALQGRYVVETRERTRDYRLDLWLWTGA